jgi:hypothetical protein
MPSAALERHPDSRCAALRGIEAAVRRGAGGELQLRYILEGEIERLRIPAPRAARAADRLWQHTCCELFVARDGASAYREFNFSPSGEWAAYAFVRYREGAALAIPDPRIALKRDPRRLELTAAVPAEPGPLKIGLSVVVEEAQLSYWAIRHPAGKPDFHHPGSFALSLE